MQESKVVVWGGLQIAEERREVKSKEEREKYTQLNCRVQFQNIAMRDKKVFWNEQRKATEEDNRMGKTRDLFNKIGEIKGTFHAKIPYWIEIVWT